MLDRAAEEAEGGFGAKIRELAPDCVIDLTAYTRESTQQLVEALRGRVQQFLHCGTIWVHGPSVEVPITEDQPRRPISDYGVRKAEIEAYLLDEARRHRISRNGASPGPPGRDGLDSVESRGELQSGGIRGSGRGPGDRAAQSGPRDTASRACGRRSAGVRAGDGALVRGGRRVLPRGLSGRRIDGRLCRGGGGMVRAAGAHPVSAVGRVAVDGIRKRTRRSPGITSPDRPVAAFARRSACWSTGPRYRSLEAVRESVIWLAANGAIEARISEAGAGIE